MKCGTSFVQLSQTLLQTTRHIIISELKAGYQKSESNMALIWVSVMTASCEVIFPKALLIAKIGKQLSLIAITTLFIVYFLEKNCHHETIESTVPNALNFNHSQFCTL